MLADRRLATAAPPPALAVPATKGRSLWVDAARRFRRNRAAFISLMILLGVVAFTIIGPFLARWSIETID